MAVPLGVVDTVMLLGLTHGPSIPTRLWLSAYLLAQRVLLGLLLGLVAEGVSRAPWRAPRWLLPVLAFATAFGVLSFLFREDLENQLAWHRPLYAGAAALAPAGIVSVHLYVRQRWLVRLGGVVGAVAFLLANHLLLPLNYPGFHVACVILSTLAGGVALTNLSGPTGFRRAHAVGLAAVLALVVWGVLIPPPSRISSRVVTHDALSLHRFTGGLFGADPRRLVHDERNPFFSRAKRATVSPGAELVPREDLIVVLLTVDAFRYDVVSGKYPLRIPTLNGLFAESIRFTNAAVPAVSTTNSIVSLFSGRYYPQIRWLDESNVHRTIQIPKLKGRRFPESLARAGVDTFLGATNWRFLPRYKAALGFDQIHKANLKGYPHAEETLPALLAWLAEQRGPAFAYTHLVDLHWPYDRGGTEGTPFEAYQRELEVLDRALGSFVAGLKQARLWNRTVLIIAADHGEAFGEHGQNQHDGWLYQELTHVPLVIRVPARPPRIVEEPVSVIDLGPTILDLFGLSVSGTHMGQSLVPFLRGESPEYQRPVAFYSKKGQGGILFPDLIKALYIPHLRQAEVYDLRKDPREMNNLVDEPWAAERVAIVRSFFAAHEHRGTSIWR